MPVASMISSAWREVLRKNPGTVRGLIGSISSWTPAAFSLPAA